MCEALLFLSAMRTMRCVMNWRKNEQEKPQPHKGLTWLLRPSEYSVSTTPLMCVWMVSADDGTLSSNVGKKM